MSGWCRASCHRGRVSEGGQVEQDLHAYGNLRDLRRYNVPVTINNPQQVNIAAAGGQQVNVSKDQDHERTVRR